MTEAQAFITALPSGIKRDVESHYQAHGDLQPGRAIRHWIEIPGTHGGSISQWTCDGYASSRQYAVMIAEALHTSFGHAYEVWSLRPFGQSQGPHILDFVPGLDTDPAKYKGDRRDTSELGIDEIEDSLRYDQAESE